jgi:fatty-acyl-CoA synthase
MTLMNRIFNDLGMKEMSNAYGMTELSPVVCMTFAKDPIEMQTTTCGRTLPN